MATKIGKQIVRAVTNALRERDRVEMRAMDAVLSLVEPPRRKARPDRGRRRTTAMRRTGTVQRLRTRPKTLPRARRSR